MPERPVRDPRRSRRASGASGAGSPEEELDAALDARLAAVEARLAEIERRLPPATVQPDPTVTPSAPTPVGLPTEESTSDDDPYFALHALQTRVPPPGAVLYTGSVDLPGGHVDWQYALPTGAILDDDWTQRATALSALAHPVRLRILQLVAEGVSTVADLSEMDDLGTTGQVYHHVRQLTAAGWLEAAGRGRYQVPVTRVVPLLTILLASR